MLINIPFELQGCISLYLSPKDILSIRLSCKYLSNFDATAFLQDMFIYHVKKGDYNKVCTLLLDRRVDSRAFENFALREAVFRSHYSIVDLLLREKKADVKTLDNVVIYIAMANKDNKMVSLLSGYCSFVDANIGETNLIKKRSGFCKS